MPESHPTSTRPAIAARELRPIAAGNECPKLREGVTIGPLFTHTDPRKNTYVIGSREVDRYIVVPANKLPVVLKIVELLDGQHSLAAIENYFLREERKKVEVAAFYERLSENGLIATSIAKVKKGDIAAMSIELFTLNIEGFFAALSKFRKLLFWGGATVLFLIIALGTPLALTHRDILGGPVKSLVQGSFRTSELLYPVLLLLSFLLHEMAHGIVAARYGLIARNVEAALYLGFIPIVYLRIPGIYTLRPVDRIKVWSAGICWNLALSSICVELLVWLPSSAYRQVWLMVAIANYFLALTNLFPFLPTDGYFILSTLLKTHNVRRNAWKEFANWITARKHRFHGASLVYFISTVAVAGLILWRDIVWIQHLRRNEDSHQYLILAYLALPWILALCWRIASRKLRGKQTNTVLGHDGLHRNLSDSNN